MGEDARRTFADFVADRHRALLRLAFLLTGDRGTGEELMRRALRRTYHGWPHAGDPLTAARRAVVRAQPRRARGPVAGDGLGPALWALPARTRAAVVLRFSEDLSLAETARVLRCSEATAESLATTGLNRLADVVGASSLEPPDAPLRRRLRVLAEAAGEPSDDLDALIGAPARGHGIRRRRRVTAALAAAALAAAAVAVVVGGAPAEGEPAPTRAVPSDEEPRFARVDVTTTRQDVFDRPTRGSLGDDEAFLRELRTVPWWPPGEAPEDAVDAPIDGRHVVFAGDVPTGRWALLVGRPLVFPAQPWGGGSTYGIMAAVWLTGPPGARADQMAPATDPTTLEAGWPAALLDATAGVLVVVANPGDVVEVSERPEIAADGTISRRFEPVETTDGIAVARLTGSRFPHGGAVAFRARHGGPDGEPLASWSMAVLDGAGDEIPLAYRRGTPSDAGRFAADHAASSVLTKVGLQPEDLDLTAEWTGAVPDGGSGRAAVVTATLPSGAVVVEGQWLRPAFGGGSAEGGGCGFAVLPAGLPAERRVLPLQCEVREVPTLVVVGPVDVALVRTYAQDGTFLSEHVAVEGVAVAPAPRGLATVEAVTSGGVSLGRVEVIERNEELDD